MSRISSRDTRPELAVRDALRKMGLKYRLHDVRLPGKPDIIVPSMKTAILINGCFWHQHSGCRRRAMPKTNREYWENKLHNNVMKQRRDVRALRKLGWKVHKIWECQTAVKEKLAERLMRVL